MAKSGSSKRWLQRHVSDPYVRGARQAGYRSRAAYKLLEIDARDRLLAPGQIVVDLGAAPGSWSQVIASRVRPGGRVIAVDLLDLEPIPGVEFVRGDFRQADILARIDRILQPGKADLVVSDLAPNLTGVAASDQSRSLELCELVLEFARSRLKPRAALLVKVFQGAGFAEFLAEMRRAFESVVSRKPKASRGGSAEMYLLGKGLKSRIQDPESFFPSPGERLD
ncbi:MAG: RlmE family RNA methyltransferase [Betaproteobacteria bacterium]|nr:RlmE family RNA methyltransferase [Betaproteobacteria bacterium]